MTIISLRHGLHSKHLAKMLMLGDSQHLHQNVCHHIIHPNEFEVDTSVCDALLDKVVLNINMLCCSMVDRVSGKKICSMIVDVQCCRFRHTFMEFREKSM